MSALGVDIYRLYRAITGQAVTMNSVGTWVTGSVPAMQTLSQLPAE